MDIAYFPNATAANSTPVMLAMLSALQVRGHRLVTDSLNADAAIIWSMLWAGKMRSNRDVFQHYRSQGKNVLVIEVGCLQRGTLWRVGVNGEWTLTHQGHSVGSQRSQLLGITLDAWRHDRGEAVLICCQRTQSHQWCGMPAGEIWLQQTIDKIRQHTDRPITVRPHPRQRSIIVPSGCSVDAPVLIPNTYDDFDFDRALEKAWAVVNHNSYPGIQSTIKGVPAFVDRSSLAAEVANLDFADINDPHMPDRTAWFESIAATEFTVQEIQQGVPLEMLGLA